MVHRDQAWVLLDERPDARLGAALVWATRAGARSLHLIAEAGTGTLARRGAEFSLPIEVWGVDGRRLVSAGPAPLPASSPPSAAHEAFRELIVEGGAVPVVEHGVLCGEVRGLEVCRVVDDPHDHTARLEVGVGNHDREAFQMLHGDVPAVESLARIVAAVAQHREVGARPHPLNRLGAERFIRWRLEQDPELVGAVEIRPAEPPLPRPNLKDPIPCVASGRDGDGGSVVVVCSSGVDLELIPFASDARLAAEAARPGIVGEVRVVVAMPSRDRLAVTGEVAALLRRPVEFVPVD